MEDGTRRDFVKLAGGAVAGLAAAAKASAQAEEGPGFTQSDLPGAEKVAGVAYTDAERQQMADMIEERLEAVRAVRAVEKPNSLAPALTFDPRLSGVAYETGVGENEVSLSPQADRPLPSNEADIAYAPALQQADWIRRGLITSRQLTDLYLRRIEAHAGTLECFVTVLADRARSEADAADAELKAGTRRGPLHGLPYALKDLFDAEGGPTTWGAAPYRDRASEGDSAVVKRLKEAGCVLLGKTTCGALAYGDIWFGGVTRNPFNPNEGSSGSSAGSASATAAGLCSFSIGTETLGSLVSPSHRCGTTALRPTFGRVSRAGGMALCWSLDKVGPMARTVEDCAAVMAAINGYDADDASSLESGFSYAPRTDFSKLRLGYDEAWLEEASDNDKAAIEAAKSVGAAVVPFKTPDLPSDPLPQQLVAEAAAAFEELTLTDQDDLLAWQDDPAWPNSFRAVRFLSAVDLIQIDRLRRKWMQALHEAFQGVDVAIGPNFASGLLTPTNFTGHPCLVMRAGFAETPTRTIFGAPADESGDTFRTPEAVSLWAPLFGEAPMLALGREIEAKLGVWSERPAGF